LILEGWFLTEEMAVVGWASVDKKAALLTKMVITNKVTIT